MWKHSEGRTLFPQVQITPASECLFDSPEEAGATDSGSHQPFTAEREPSQTASGCGTVGIRRGAFVSG